MLFLKQSYYICTSFKAIYAAIACIVFFIFFLSLFPVQTEGLNLSQVSDVMTRLRTNTPADHTIQFTAVNGVGFPNTGDTIFISFGNALSSMNGISYEDIQLLYGDIGQELSHAVYSSSGTNIWGVAIDNQQKTLTFIYPSSNGTPIVTGQRVIIRIGTHAGGTRQLINGSTPGSHTILVRVGTRDARNIAIALLQNDAVGAGAPVAEIPPGGAVFLPVTPAPSPLPTKTAPTEPVQPPQEEQMVEVTPAPSPLLTETAPAKPVQSPQEEQVTEATPLQTPIPAETLPTPTQPAPTTPPKSITVSLGMPASVILQSDKVSSASVINTNTSGETTGFFAEIEKNTVTEDGKITIEPISLAQASNLDSEIRIPSDKDVPDKVFYKINVNTNVEKPIRITIKYNPLLLAGVNPTSLKINYWNPETNKWIPLEDTVIDTEQGTLSAYVIPQTIYAALATITSREKLRKREQTIIKSSIAFIPRNSGIAQTDLALSQKTDAEPIRFVNYDFYTSGAREMMLCIKEKLFLKPVASVFLDFMNKQEKLFYNKTFKCFGGFITSPIDEGTYPIKLKVVYKDDYTEIISPNLVVTTPLQAFIRPIMRWVIEDIQSSSLAMAGVYGSLILLLLGIWFAIDRRLRKIRIVSPILSLSKK